MSSTIVVKQCGIGNFEWLQLDGQRAGDDSAGQEPPQLFVGDSERLQQQSQEVDSVILLAEAEKVALKTADFDDHERKILRQTIPYSVEDDCVDDVEDLHFSLGKTEGNKVPLAIIKRDQLEQLLTAAGQDGADVQQLVSELSLIPLEEQSWSILVNGDQWLVRCGPYQGFALERDTAALGLQLLLDDTEELPEQVIVYAPEEEQAAILNQLPELLRGIVDWRDQSYWQVIEAGLAEPQIKAKSINMLQGAFARSLPWLKWWRMWRLVGVLLITVIIVRLVTSYIELSVLEQRNLDLRADIEKTYRSVVPRGAVRDPEKQLKDKVGSLMGARGGGFVRLLQQIAPVLAEIDGVSLQSLNYSGKQSEVRLTIVANGFNDVETVRANLEKLGLKAELTGSSAEGAKTRARLRIRG